MAAPPQDNEPSQSSSGYEDGLGRRSLAFDRETGGILERLLLRPELCAFEATLNERIALLLSMEDERFARPRAIERDADDRLVVVSEYVSGRRLSDLLDSSTEHGIVAGLDAGLGMLLELLPAVARLHEAGMVHGVLGPGRVMITPASQVVLLDPIYAEALERLHLTRTRLWSEFRLAFPPTAGASRFDAAADLGHAAMIAATLTVGRVLRDDDYPEGISLLRQEILEIASIRGSKAFADSVDRFFASTLPLAGRRGTMTADEAAIDLRKLLRKELGINTCRSALVEFFQQIETADTERAAAEAAELERQRPAFLARVADDTRVDTEKRDGDRKRRADAERKQRERLETERLERERAETARLDAERLERERAEKARLEAERLEAERQEAERQEGERLEAERLERERAEKTRLEAERKERERLEAERKERERLEAERLERDRAEKARLEAERKERERLEAERKERERLEAERLERDRAEKARLEAERIERERLEAERKERERLEAERLERERAEKARLEAERKEHERLEADRKERERLEAERKERERLEAERRERERAEAERREREQGEQARRAAEQLERERHEAERVAEEARRKAERLEREQREVEERERQRVEAERRERERVEREQAEADRAESERAARAAAERDAPSDAAAAAPPSNWLIPPGQYTKFEPPAMDQPPSAPAPLIPPPAATSARPYPIYVPPAEPAAWNADLSAAEAPAPVPAAPIAATPSIPPPTPSMPVAAPSRHISIRATNEPDPALFAPARSEGRRDHSLDDDVSAEGAYEPYGTTQDRQPIPWKLIAAGVVLIAATFAITRYTPAAAPVVATVRKVIPKPPAAAPPPVAADLGRLTITSQPAGAKVVVDGKAAGETPLTIDGVKPGKHTIALSGAEGSAKRTVKVEAGQTAAVEVPLYSGFVAISIPFVVNVAERGKAIGTSEEQIILSPGKHELRLSNKDLDYSATETVEVQPGEVARLQLDPRGRANINAAPWAEVWIDGEKAGDTPLANVPIRLGVREVVFKNPQYPDRKQTVTVTASATATVSVDFIK